MPDRPSRPIPRPMGRAIRRTAEERAQAASIGARAILDGRMLWQETAPAGWEGLIEARVETPGKTQ